MLGRHSVHSVNWQMTQTQSDAKTPRKLQITKMNKTKKNELKEYVVSKRYRKKTDEWLALGTKDDLHYLEFQQLGKSHSKVYTS